LVLVDLEGKETPLDLPPGAYQNPRFSPDGNRIAFNLYEGHSVETWVFDRKSGRRYKLPSEGNNIVPNWHPEGDRISFYSDREGAGKWKYYWQKVDGTAEPEPLFDAKQEGYGWFGAQDWSPDGKILIGPGSLEFSDDTERGAELLYLPLEDSPQLSLLIERQRRVGLHGTSFSPNGKWVAFVADEAGAIGSTAQVYVTRLPEGGQKWMVSKEGGTCPVRSPHGKRIYFEKSRHMMVVDLETEPEPEAGEPRALWNFTENKYSAGDDYTRPNWDISPDGGYFIVTREAADREPPTNVNVTTNFFEVLREKVPTE
jgi:Tol biopolymer transport system component